MISPKLSVLDSGGRLSLDLGDGSQRTIVAATLWSECPGALARRRRLDGRGDPPPGLKISALAEVSYGIHVAFSSDPLGGVFPWPMLIALSQRPEMHDFIVS
jgi:DUF971 family protein